jgi:porphobilinogen synthase
MIKNRGRRLRKTSLLREMIADVNFSINDLVYPVFIEEDLEGKTAIQSMEGIYRLGEVELLKEVEECISLGVRAFLLFGIPKHKDCCGTEAYNPNGIIQKSVRLLKEKFDNILIITDVCMCEYTSHGHCGILEGETLLNDESAKLMAKIALSHAQAGADIVAPSDMMDGRIGLIREALDNNGITSTYYHGVNIKLW